MTEDLKKRGGREGSSDAPAHRTDRVVFGVTAVITVAFVIWGSTATDSLESVSTKMLNGLIHNGGWAFMPAGSCFVVFALWLAIRPAASPHAPSPRSRPHRA